MTLPPLKEVEAKAPSYGVAFTQTCPITNLGPRGQYNRTVRLLVSVLKSMGPFEIYPEFTVNGNIHYHGRIDVRDKVNYNKGVHYLRRTLGFNLFKCIDNEDKWQRYISKDVSAMQILLAVPLPITESCNDDWKPKWSINKWVITSIESCVEPKEQSEFVYKGRDSEKPLEGLVKGMVSKCSGATQL